MTWRDSVPENYRNMEFDSNVGLLPVGYQDEDGVIHRIVEFRPDGIIALDEHAMADPKYRGNGAKGITALFSNGLVQSIGTIKYDPDDRKGFSDIIRKLTAADRDYLLMFARVLSFGPEATYEHTCPSCREVNEVTVNLEEEISVKYLSDDHPREQGQPVFETELPVGFYFDGKRHNKIVFRLPTGLDAEALAMIARQNMSKANSELFQRIILRAEGIKRLSPALFNTMSAKDRQFFNRALGDVTPGPDFNQTITCAGCGRQIKTVIPISVFLSDSL